MSYLAVFLFLASLWYRPAAILALAAAIPLLVLMAGREPDAPLRLAALSVLVMMAMRPVPVSYGILPEMADGCIVRALQDSAQRAYRSAGYRARLISASCRGSLHSAEGIIYVISDQEDAMAGDVLYIKGRADGPLFRSSSSALISSPPLRGIRRAMREHIIARFGRSGAGELATRLVLGTGEMGSFGISSLARASGLAHVLALSGMHLSIIAVMMSRLLSFLNRKHSYRIITAFLLLFTFLSGWRPSLLRAFLFRLLIRFTGSIEDAFLFSALLLFALFPEASLDIGAQLSLLSLGGIFLLSERIDEGIRMILPLPPAISSSAAASLSALVSAVPLTAYVFGTYTAGSLVFSLPASIMIAAYMAISILCIVFPLFFLLDAAFIAIGKLFALAALFPETDEPCLYAAMLLAASALYALGYAKARHNRQVNVSSRYVGA